MNSGEFVRGLEVQKVTVRAGFEVRPFLPFYRVKMHVPKSRRILPRTGSDFISRAPLSIRALRSARNERIRLRKIFVRKLVSFFPAQSRPLARLVQDDGSRKLPQTTQGLHIYNLRAAGAPLLGGMRIMLKLVPTEIGEKVKGQAANGSTP